MRYELPHHARYNEKELIVKGDEFAFATLVTNYKNRIYSIAFNLTKFQRDRRRKSGSGHY